MTLNTGIGPENIQVPPECQPGYSGTALVSGESVQVTSASECDDCIRRFRFLAFKMVKLLLDGKTKDNQSTGISDKSKQKLRKYDECCVSLGFTSVFLIGKERPLCVYLSENAARCQYKARQKRTHIS